MHQRLLETWLARRSAPWAVCGATVVTLLLAWVLAAIHAAGLGPSSDPGMGMVLVSAVYAGWLVATLAITALTELFGRHAVPYRTLVLLVVFVLTVTQPMVWVAALADR